MALVVEDGTGLETAQTYATVTQLKSFAAARGLSVPSAQGDCEVLLVKAADAMRGLAYKGERVSKAQAMDFPRSGVCIDGFSYASTEIPIEVVHGQCALAIEAQTTDLLPTAAASAYGPVIQETVGPVSTTYAESGVSRSTPLVQKARIFLAKVLSHGGNTMAIIRG